MAFQDGRTSFSQLEELNLINKEPAEKYNIEPLIKTFERGMPIDFLTIDRRNLKFKMDIASKAQMKKLITFVFSHFLSLNPMYPSDIICLRGIRNLLRNNLHLFFFDLLHVTSFSFQSYSYLSTFLTFISTTFVFLLFLPQLNSICRT
jgi:hypothetical protein